MKDKHLVVLCSCPDEATAGMLARTLVSERLAACVSQVAGVRSTYRWEGRTHEDEEILLIIKTSAERLATLSARIEALHPYEVPEVIAVEVAGGSERYLAWLGQTVSET
jgi:periplasmic divalent cation tolerance protein